MKHPCLLVHRDGVLLDDHGVLRRAEDILPLQGSFEAVGRSCIAGYPVAILSCPPADDRELLSEANEREIRAALEAGMHPHGAALKKLLFSTSGFDGHLGPETYSGLLLRTALEHKLNLAESLFVGDRLSVLEAALDARVGWVCLVLTGQGARHESTAHARGNARLWICRDLAEAVDRWLSEPPQTRA